MEFTINHYYGKQNSRCGYCKDTKSSISHGMHAYTMFPQDYQELIDRGWRRSGLYCYKPSNDVTCCPCYTIKCNALEFKLNKSHKKILKRMNRFLRDGKQDKSEIVAAAVELNKKSANNADNIREDGDGLGTGGLRDEPQEPNIAIETVDLQAVAAANPEKHEAARKEHQHFDDVPTKQTTTDGLMTAAMKASESLSSSKKSIDSINPPRKKAKQMRIERHQAKLAAKGIAGAESNTKSLQPQQSNQEKLLSDYFSEASPTDKHKLQLKLVSVESQQFKMTLKRTYALYQKYQTYIHKDPPTHLSEYLEFLQQSPVKYTKTRDGPSTGYGSFHQQYWLDDKLIAVAVIDILPFCISSVYFFYDPDYSFLSLGTYGSLREIELVQQFAKKTPALQYYYMGFYIHSCPKMRYKGRLMPSYLLCPEAFTWHLLTDAIRVKLDEHKYQRLNSDTTVKDEQDFQESHLNEVVLLHENTYLTYRQYIQITGDEDDRDLIIEYGRLVGKSLAHRMLYVKN